MEHIKLFEDFNQKTPEQEAQDILDDILQEREPEELYGMTEQDALDTVLAYGHTEEEANTIANILHTLAQGV
jgi:cytochrome P450